MRAFIVRPFGVKHGIDFDRVEAHLIVPALDRAAISGRTSGEVVEAGNIRVDVFEQLLTADIVIADVSIHHASVFYELGVWHALRRRQTIFIRARGQADIPFDLRTDRDVEYEPGNPAAAADLLFNVIGQSRTSERVDSPIFLVMPELSEPNRSSMTPVPRDFLEDVARAGAARRRGVLGLLGWEVQGFAWETEGRRLVGREQFNLRAFAQAEVTWSDVRGSDPSDREANLALATIYQRLRDLTRSDQCLERVLLNPTLQRSDYAEACALLGRNEKSRWVDGLQQSGHLAPSNREDQRSPTIQQHALDSPLLLRSYKRYQQAFARDLNHYYSGLNALSLLTIALELATLHPQVWNDQFESDEDADREHRRLERDRGDLSGAVNLALAGARAQLPQGASDLWLDISLADYRFLTSPNDNAAARAYRTALASASEFHVESARSQLMLFQSLSIRTERVEACLAALPPVRSRAEIPPSVVRHMIAFTGHAIDSPDRLAPRFPASAVSEVRSAIKTAIVDIAKKDPGTLLGMAAASSGADILFHEVCDELGVATRVCLPLPPPAFAERAVESAGADWMTRFENVIARHPVEVLASSELLPNWLTRKGGYDVWQRNNMWLLQEALAVEAATTHLMALWDGVSGEGPGSIQQVVASARQGGVQTVLIDPRNLRRE